MTAQAEELLRRVLELPADERADVAAELLASLDDSPADTNVEAEWAAEIERRARRVLAGQSKSAPWPEVRRELEGNLPKR